jgi:DNA mismatch repair protein MutL
VEPSKPLDPRDARGPSSGGRDQDLPRGPRIRVLPDALVDQIAAGEVVERPASVVKELVENALDAGAGRIRVEVRDGGTRSIVVADDGCGMSRDEARLALQRHATSKLASADDLMRIESYGFRGEALPAIASVSRLRLLTCARGATVGCEVRVDGGRIVSEREAGAPEGTRVEVADLFAAVPARRKFLKAPSTEWGHVAGWVARAALARPDVHFDLQRDERPALSWPATADPLDRVAAVLSEDEAAAMLAAYAAAGRFVLRGFVSRPDWHRASAEGIQLFVNARPVRDRLLRHAVLDAYRDVLPRSRFPSVVLFLELPPEAVDVNVHPAKWEVRFADPRAIHQLVSHAVRDAIATRGWLGAEAAVARAAPTSEPIARGGASDWVFARPSPAQAVLAIDGGRADDAASPLPAAAETPRFRGYRRLGQLLASYLLLESKDGLVLVDQHAAHERVLYERLRAGWLAGGVARQALLSPLPVELEAAACAAVSTRLALLRELGFELEPFGETTLLVRAVPALLADRDPAPLVRSLADELRAGAGEGALQSAGAARTRLLGALDHVFATLACHSARTQGEVLDAREQEALIAALDDIPWAPTCPHGRPVALPIGLSEIERRFGRR